MPLVTANQTLSMPSPCDTDRTTAPAHSCRGLQVPQRAKNGSLRPAVAHPPLAGLEPLIQRLPFIFSARKGPR